MKPMGSKPPETLHTYKLKIKKMKRDGNCLFTAISNELLKLGYKTHRQEHLRELAVDSAQQLRASKNDTDSLASVLKTHSNAELAQMLFSGEWASNVGDLMLHILCTIYHVNCNIYDSETEQLLPHLSFNKFSDTSDRIHLVYSGAHWDATEKSNNWECPVCTFVNDEKKNKCDSCDSNKNGKNKKDFQKNLNKVLAEYDENKAAKNKNNSGNNNKKNVSNNNNNNKNSSNNSNPSAPHPPISPPIPMVPVVPIIKNNKKKERKKWTCKNCDNLNWEEDENCLGCPLTLKQNRAKGDIWQDSNKIKNIMNISLTDGIIIWNNRMINSLQKRPMFIRRKTDGSKDSVGTESIGLNDDKEKVRNINWDNGDTWSLKDEKKKDGATSNVILITTKDKTAFRMFRKEGSNDEYEIIWNNEDRSEELIYQPKAYSMILDNKRHYGYLESENKLVWDDGDIWEKIKTVPKIWEDPFLQKENLDRKRNNVDDVKKDTVDDAKEDDRLIQEGIYCYKDRTIFLHYEIIKKKGVYFYEERQKIKSEIKSVGKNEFSARITGNRLVILRFQGDKCITNLQGGRKITAIRHNKAKDQLHSYGSWHCKYCTYFNEPKRSSNNNNYICNMCDRVQTNLIAGYYKYTKRGETFFYELKENENGNITYEEFNEKNDVYGTL
eukprot:UN02442